MPNGPVCEGAVHNVVQIGSICVGCWPMTIHQPVDAPAPSHVVRKGEDFSIKVDVGHSELLGDLQIDYVADLHCHNIATGGTEASYSKTGESGTLDVDGTKEKFEFTFTAGVAGVFRHYFCIGFPESDLATFVQGPVFFIFD